MLGPSSSALIQVGARFPPCMKLVDGVPLNTQFGCEPSYRGLAMSYVLILPAGLNNTANPPDRLCSLEDICGFGGFDGKEPNQWFR